MNAQREGVEVNPELPHSSLVESYSRSDVFKDIRDSWYQISNVQSLVCS